MRGKYIQYTALDAWPAAQATRKESAQERRAIPTFAETHLTGWGLIVER